MSNRKNPPIGSTLVEMEHLTDKAALRQSEVIFRFCTLEGFEVHGAIADGAFLNCTLKDVEFYWGLFNCCTLVHCRFERCRFRGTGFGGSLFAECSFVDCSFEQDNLGGECSFDGSSWYACTQSACRGLDRRFAAAA